MTPTETPVGFLHLHLEVGGPMYKIKRCGKIYEFELNQFAGPNILNKKTGSPLKNQPMPFLEAVSLWLQQGKRMENGLCRWDHDPEKILKHLGGRHYLVLGFKEPERGE